MQHFDFGSLNPGALTLMRNAIAWATVPGVYTGVKIVLQVEPDSTHRVEADVRILNMPKVKGS